MNSAGPPGVLQRVVRKPRESDQEDGRSGSARRVPKRGQTQQEV